MRRAIWRLAGRGAAMMLAAALVAGCATNKEAEPKADLAVATAVAPAPTQTLAQQLDAIFDDKDFANAFWGVRVERMDGTVIYERNAAKSFAPASNMKVVTTAAALETFGPDYTYKTTLEARGPIENGVLKGDLVIVGSGDPSLGTWRVEGRLDGEGLLQQWAEKVKAAGITSITGAIIADGRVYTPEYYSGDWELSDMPFWYATGISGVNFSENVIRFTTSPGATVGAPATITIKPQTAYVTAINKVETVDAKGEKTADITHRDPESNEITFGGTVPLGVEPFEQRGAIWDGELYAATLLTEALVRDGIAVSEPAQTVRHIAADRVDSVPADKRLVLDTVTSPPMKELIRIVNKPSHNFYADCLFRTLGAAKKQKGDFAGGGEAVAEWLKSFNAPNVDYYKQLDGSGLARRNMVTPALMCAILRHMDSRPELRDVFKTSLPEAGIDSKEREGWKAPELHNNLFAKTGYIGGVRALSGYVKDSAGEPLVFSMISNQIVVPMKRADKAIDEAVLVLAKGDE